MLENIFLVISKEEEEWMKCCHKIWVSIRKILLSKLMIAETKADEGRVEREYFNSEFSIFNFYAKRDYYVIGTNTKEEFRDKITMSWSDRKREIEKNNVRGITFNDQVLSWVPPFLFGMLVNSVCVISIIINHSLVLPYRFSTARQNWKIIN